MQGAVHTRSYSDVHRHTPRGAQSPPRDFKRINSLEFESRVSPYLANGGGGGGAADDMPAVASVRHHSTVPHTRLHLTHMPTPTHHKAHSLNNIVVHARQHHGHVYPAALSSLPPTPSSSSISSKMDFELISNDGRRSVTPPHHHVHTPTHAAAVAAAHARTQPTTTPPLPRSHHGHAHAHAHAHARGIPLPPPPVCSPLAAVGDGPIERLGDELLIAATVFPDEHQQSAVPTPVAQRSVFDEPLHKQSPQQSPSAAKSLAKPFQDNYLRPKASSIDGALPRLDEFSALRLPESHDTRTQVALSRAHAPPPPQQHSSSLKVRHQHQRARSHGIMGTQGLRLRTNGRGGDRGRAAEAPARVPSEENGDLLPPMPEGSMGPGGLLPYKRRKRGRRPSAQAQREKRETKRSVYVSPLPAGASFETVRDLLKDFGGLQTVEFIEDGKSCYARFESYPQADRAVDVGTVGDDVVIMPKKVRVEEVKELQESLAELDAKKKLLQERLGPLAAAGASASASAGSNGGVASLSATGVGVSSTSGIARANALRESGRGHQRHASTPTGTRFGGGSGGGGHHRFSSNPPTGIQALSAGKALRHGGGNGKGGGNSRKGSLLGGSGALASPSAPPPPGLMRGGTPTSTAAAAAGAGPPRFRRATSCHELEHAFRHISGGRHGHGAGGPHHVHHHQHHHHEEYTPSYAAFGGGSYGSSGRRGGTGGGDRSGANSRRSSTNGGNAGTGNANSRRLSLTSEQLEGSWRGGGGGGSAHRRAYSDMNPLNAPQRGGGSGSSGGSSRFGGPGPSQSHASNNLSPPSAGIYQPPQVQQQLQQSQTATKAPANASASTAAAGTTGSSASTAATDSVVRPSADAAPAAGSANLSSPTASGASVASITVTAPQPRARGDSANAVLSSSLVPPGLGNRVVVNRPSSHGTTGGLAAVSVAPKPGSRRGSVAGNVATHLAKGPDGSKGFNWKQNPK